MKNCKRGNATVVILIVIAAIVYVVFFSSEKWQGFYYPDGCLSCEEDYIFSPTFEGLDQCRDWAEDLKSRRSNSNDLYECGKNCKLLADGSGMYLCKETVD